MSDHEDRSPPAASTLALELAVAGAAFVFGGIVIVDSLRLGAGWADDGPQAGYFPFYVGLAICVASAVTFASALRNRHAAQSTFVTRAQLGRILQMLVPAALYAIAIAFVGIYVSSAVFLAYFMARHGSYKAWVIAAVSIGLPVALFMMFEKWFSTPLPKGPLEALLGFA